MLLIEERDMRFLLLPTRFTRPESMGEGDISVWTNWIHEENEVVMNQLDEEQIARGDPDDPFNGSANGVFHPLQDNFSLTPPCKHLEGRKMPANLVSIHGNHRELAVGHNKTMLK